MKKIVLKILIVVLLGVILWVPNISYVLAEEGEGVANSIIESKIDNYDSPPVRYSRINNCSIRL